MRRNDKKMQNLRNVCESIYSGNNKIFGRRLPLASMNMIIDAYSSLRENGSAESIFMDVKFVLEKCGFIAVPHGIGWIYRN